MQHHLRLEDLALETPKVLDPDLGRVGRQALLSWHHLLVVATPARGHCRLELLVPRLADLGTPSRLDLHTLPLCDHLPWPRRAKVTPGDPDLAERIRGAFAAACGPAAIERLRLARLLAGAHALHAGLPMHTPFRIDARAPDGPAERQLRRLTRNLRVSARRALFQGDFQVLDAPQEILPLAWDGTAHQRLQDAQALARLLRGERLPPLPGDH